MLTEWLEKQTLGWYIADGLHVPRWNKTKTPLLIALSGTGKGVEGDVTNVQCKSNQNCHYESPTE
jgi:hypothetical protein